MDGKTLEFASKFLALLSDVAKFLALTALSVFAVIAVAFPDLAKERLDKLGLQVKEVSGFGVKLVAKETVKAGAGVLDVAEALTKTEMSLATIQQELVDGSKVSTQSAGVNKAVADAMGQLQTARSALDRQALALNSAGNAAGVIADAPTTAWIFVGNFGENNEPRFVSPRIDPKGVLRTGKQLTSLLLKYDAPVVSNGNDCTRVDLADVPPPSPDAKEKEYVILRASPTQALEVIAVSECPSAGNGKTVYAQIRIPRERVRFARLSELKQ